MATTVGCDLNDTESVSGLISELPQIAKLQKELGAGFVVLLPPMITGLFSGDVVKPRKLTPGQRSQFNAKTKRIGRMVRDDFGLILTVHRHVNSHLETEEEIESLLEATDPNYDSPCLDVGQHAYGGGDACQFIRNRIPYIHLKHSDGDVLAKMRQKGWPLAETVNHDIMCEPWKGIVDFNELKQVLDEVGYSGHAVVEQDMCPAPPERPFPIAQKTREYLKIVGIG